MQESIPDLSRPLQPAYNWACSLLYNSQNVVSDGLDRPPTSHNLVTSDYPNVTSASQQDILFAKNKIKSYGTHQCKQFRKEIFESHPQFALSMASDYTHIADRKNYIEANLKLLSIDKRLKIGSINFSCSKLPKVYGLSLAEE
jgi:hypothetical protein